MLRPPSGCSTFIVLDFIRVPLPAASTTTATGRVCWVTRSRSLLWPVWLGVCRLTFGSPGRSRTYVALSAFKVRRALPTDQPGIDSRV